MSDKERNYHSTDPNAKPAFDDIDWDRYGRDAELLIGEEDGSSGPAPEEPPEEMPEEPIQEPDDEAESWEEAEEEPQETGQDPLLEAEEYDEAEQEAYQRDYQPRRKPLPPPDQLPPPEQPARPKKKKRRRVRSLAVTFLVAMLYVVSVLAISFVAATFGWRWANDLLALNKQTHTAEITIQAGEGVDEVAEKLKENGLIEYPFLFEVFAGFTNKAEKISSGTYELNTDMDYSALLNKISASSSARVTVTVTIPEGYTVEEIFQLLESQGACTVEALEESAMNDEFNYSFLEGLERDDPYWMEGYLFPDTYEFYKDGDAKVAISKILYNYLQKFDSEMKTRAERLGYSQQEIMVIASIIEKETDGSDQADIASVIYNRLKPDNNETLGKLQMDSTIQYILEERKEKLTEEDLAIDSPYNTYLYEGLPSGPICNPGMAAIEAALYPNATTYYYFILGNDGVTHFFSSYSEFNDYREGVVNTKEEEDIGDLLESDDKQEEQE